VSSHLRESCDERDTDDSGRELLGSPVATRGSREAGLPARVPEVRVGGEDLVDHADGADPRAARGAGLLRAGRRDRAVLLPADVSAAPRAGILGGWFDPPHLGHLHLARAAHDAFALDSVALLPAHRPPHKPAQHLASDAHRLAMVRALARLE